jgi:hypothetical protein
MFRPALLLSASFNVRHTLNTWKNFEGNNRPLARAAFFPPRYDALNQHSMAYIPSSRRQ